MAGPEGHVITVTAIIPTAARATTTTAAGTASGTTAAATAATAATTAAAGYFRPHVGTRGQLRKRSSWNTP